MNGSAGNLEQTAARDLQALPEAPASAAARERLATVEPPIQPRAREELQPVEPRDLRVMPAMAAIRESAGLQELQPVVPAEGLARAEPQDQAERAALQEPAGQPEMVASPVREEFQVQAEQRASAETQVSVEPQEMLEPPASEGLQVRAEHRALAEARVPVVLAQAEPAARADAPPVRPTAAGSASICRQTTLIAATATTLARLALHASLEAVTLPAR